MAQFGRLRPGPSQEASGLKAGPPARSRRRPARTTSWVLQNQIAPARRPAGLLRRGRAPVGDGLGRRQTPGRCGLRVRLGSPLRCGRSDHQSAAGHAQEIAAMGTGDVQPVPDESCVAEQRLDSMARWLILDLGRGLSNLPFGRVQLHGQRDASHCLAEGRVRAVWERALGAVQEVTGTQA